MEPSYHIPQISSGQLTHMKAPKEPLNKAQEIPSTLIQETLNQTRLTPVSESGAAEFFKKHNYTLDMIPFFVKELKNPDSGLHTLLAYFGLKFIEQPEEIPPLKLASPKGPQA